MSCRGRLRTSAPSAQAFAALGEEGSLCTSGAPPPPKEQTKVEVRVRGIWACLKYLLHGRDGNSAAIHIHFLLDFLVELLQREVPARRDDVARTRVHTREQQQGRINVA